MARRHSPSLPSSPLDEDLLGGDAAQAQGDIAPVGDPELDQLALLADLGEAPTRKFNNRSWEHTKHARSAKKIKGLEADKAKLESSSTAMASTLVATAGHLAPGAAKLAASLLDEADLSEARVVNVTRLAFSATIKGAWAAPSAEASSVSCGSQCIADSANLV